MVRSRQGEREKERVIKNQIFPLGVLDIICLTYVGHEVKCRQPMPK